MKTNILVYYMKYIYVNFEHETRISFFFLNKKKGGHDRTVKDRKVDDTLLQEFTSKENEMKICLCITCYDDYIKHHQATSLVVLFFFLFYFFFTT